MKKICLLLIVLLLLLTGCGGDKNVSENLDVNTPPPGPSQEPGGDMQPKEYIFEYKGTQIIMNEEAAPILEKLGDASDYFEAESCAFQGLDKIYTYSGFELHTYEIDGVDYVASIILLDDSVATKEGVYLYSGLDDVLTAYGDKYTKDLDLYTYRLGMSKILFLIENDEVVSIEYVAVTE